jgi:signal transduction histidine kinase
MEEVEQDAAAPARGGRARRTRALGAGPAGYEPRVTRRNRRVRLGLWVWLPAVLALLVAATAAAVAAVFVGRFDGAFEQRAEQIAVGLSVDAAIRLSHAENDADVARIARTASTELSIAVFALDRDGQLLTASRSQGTSLAELEGLADAEEAALSGRRAVVASPDGTGTLVALPVRQGPAGAVVAYASHPELEAGLGIARSKITEAALWGVLVGGLAGMLVAALIARRLRRIAASASAIESGDFSTRVSSRFPDEVGDLARSLDRMRVHLRQSFSELGAQRDRLERLLERLHEGVLTVDAAGRVEFANDAARELLAGTGLQVGRPLPEPWPALSLGGLARELFRDDARPAHARVEDDDRTLALVGIPARGSETVVLVLRDLTEDERRERAEREFVANAAHELRTPLQTILGAVEALNAGAKDDAEEQARFLGHIEREGKRLARLTRALLVLARAQTRAEGVSLSPVAVRPLLEDIAAGLTVADGVAVQVTCPEDLDALGDRDVLEQAVANLAANAARHTEAGRIVLRGVPGDDGSVVVAVEDTGPGIPVQARTRAFDRFYRPGARDSEGFGLGLAIARESARALGGDIELHDGPGGGTLALIVLPAVDRQAA